MVALFICETWGALIFTLIAEHCDRIRMGRSLPVYDLAAIL